MEFELFSTLKNKPRFKPQLIKKVLKEVVNKLQISPNFKVTILLVGDQKMTSLNKKYKGKNQTTDVLTFSQYEGSAIVLPQSEKGNLGDIVICYPQLLRQARNYKQTAAKEFSLLLIHGFLHLLGYEDETAAKRKQMEKIQQKILAKIYD